MGIDAIEKTVLEPHAGSGNIVDWLKPFAKEILICEFGKIIGRIDSYSSCYFFARV
jgi:hypothetical protein